MFRAPGVEMSTWLLGIFMALSCVVAGGFPAERAVSEAYSHNDSSTTLYSSDNYLKCTSDLQVTVASTQEISDLIKLHTSGSEPVRIRATRRGFHSSMGFVCSGHRGSSHAEYREVAQADNQLTSVTVLLHLMNRVVAVDNDHHQMTVEAGMTLRELTLAAEANHMSVPAGTLPFYGNLTVGGSIMTSAHGTAYRTATSLGNLVQKLKWVNANGEVILSEVLSDEVRALVGGLGLLGIVTEITLQLQPNSQTIVEVRKGLNDTTMVTDLKKLLLEETPHVAAFWRPDFGKYKAALWTQVEDGKYDSTTTPKFYPNGTIALLTPFDAQVATSLKHLMAAWEDDVTDELPSADLLNAEICMVGQAALDGSVFEDGDGNVLEYAVIPTNYAMVSAECAPRCSWDVHYTGRFTESAEFTIKLSRFEEWVKDVRRIVRMELAEVDDRLSRRYGAGKVMGCLSPGFILLRFGQGDRTLLSISTGSEDLVYVQPVFTHSALVPNKLAKVSAIVETIEQLTLCRYEGRPHWGKNHERTVRHPKCAVRDNYPAENIAELLEMQQRHDPRKVFEPELFSKLLEKSGPEYSPLCTPHYWCYCAADWHCPAGFECRASASFSEYKICKLANNNLLRDEL